MSFKLLNIIQLRTKTPRWIIVFIDVLISICALFLAYLIRFDLKADPNTIEVEWGVLKNSLAIFILTRIIVFYLFKVHLGIVRFTSYSDLSRIFKAVTLSSFLYFIFGWIRYHFFDGFFLFPTSVLVMDYLICLFLMIALRFTIKLIYLESKKSYDFDERVLIYGAGVSGVVTKKSIDNDPRLSYDLIGFLDEDKILKGSMKEGLKIYHTSQLKEIIEKEKVTLVIIAIQHPDENILSHLLNECLSLNVKVNKVPSLKSWVNGEFTTKQIGKVKIEDLLGRKQIVLDEDKISKELKDKIVLVTGAAGSIGSGMVRQIAKYQPKKIFLLDQAESPLYDFQNELKNEFENLNFEVIIADIRSLDRMKRVFDFCKPNYVFHAAAYKHVPLMEDNPSEAILTNVKGTQNIVSCAIDQRVDKFVMISTDKAVNPTNVMGASKRIAEMIVESANQKGITKFVTTRFGNVLGSNGSVIPLFQKQIEQGGPITLTDERITRFFMTIPEACQLVLEAGTMGHGGEVFVFDMGESVKIIDLAQKMIQLSGLQLGKDIEIKITGLRPGEKLYEELLAKEECTIPTHHPKILKAKLRDTSEEQIEKIQYLIQLFENQDNNAIVRTMKAIVPEFISNNSNFEKLDYKDDSNL